MQANEILFKKMTETAPKTHHNRSRNHFIYYEAFLKFMVYFLVLKLQKVLTYVEITLNIV